MGLQIKFAHDFIKLHGQKKATLLSVNMIAVKKLNEDFVRYDTTYYNDEMNIIFYPVPSGNVSVLILVFIGEKLIPFTTFRGFGTARKAKYESQIGEVFEILIEPIKIVPVIQTKLL